MFKIRGCTVTHRMQQNVFTFQLYMWCYRDQKTDFGDERALFANFPVQISINGEYVIRDHETTNGHKIHNHKP